MTSFSNNDLVKLKACSEDCSKNKVAMYRELSGREILSLYLKSVKNGKEEDLKDVHPNPIKIDYDIGTIMFVSKEEGSLKFDGTEREKMCQLLDHDTGVLLWTSVENVELA